MAVHKHFCKYESEKSCPKCGGPMEGCAQEIRGSKPIVVGQRLHKIGPGEHLGYRNWLQCKDKACGYEEELEETMILPIQEILKASAKKWPRKGRLQKYLGRLPRGWYFAGQTWKVNQFIVLFMAL